MSSQWMTVAWANLLNYDVDTTRLIYFAIAERAAPDGMSPVRVQDLCDQLGYSERTVWRALADIEGQGDMVAVSKGGGRGRHNVYRLIDRNGVVNLATTGNVSAEKVATTGNVSSVNLATTGNVSAPADGLETESSVLESTPSVSSSSSTTTSSPSTLRVLPPGAADTPKISDGVATAWAAYRSKIQPKAIVCPEVKIAARIKRFGLDGVLAAIDHFSASEWKMEHNAHQGAAWFFSSDPRIESYINLDPEKDNANHRRATARYGSDPVDRPYVPGPAHHYDPNYKEPARPLPKFEDIEDLPF